MKNQFRNLSVILLMLAGLLIGTALSVSAAEPVSLRIEPSDSNGIPSRITAFKTASGYQLFLPGKAKSTECYLTWDNGGSAVVGGATYVSGACPIPAPGSVADYSFGGTRVSIETYQGSSSVPAVFIEINETNGNPTIEQMDNSPDHSVECKGTIYIDGTEYELTKKKGRGNASWKE